MHLAWRVAGMIVLCAIALTSTPVALNAAPPANTPITYIVQAGDTLFAIAQRHNTTVAAIKQLNNLNSDTILVGRRLLIPTSDAVAVPASSSYIVQPGDSLYRVASRYGTTMRELMRLNDLPNPNLVYVGQALAIPDTATLVKPGLIVEPASAKQGGTLVIQVANPDAVVVSGTFNGKAIAFTRAVGYWYALVGISRCAKIGNAPLTIKITNVAGQSTTETTTVNVESTAFIVQAINLPPAASAILSNRDLINDEAAQLAAIVNRYTSTRLWSGAFRQPVYSTITSAFGTQRSYNGGPVGACGHEGTDFNTAAGLAVYAPARGRVVFAALTQVRGNLIVIDHGIGVFSAYYHLAEINMQAGKVVEPGALIGKIGSTGLSTGPHLHWSMWVNGEYVDPMEWTRRVLP